MPMFDVRLTFNLPLQRHLYLSFSTELIFNKTNSNHSRLLNRVLKGKCVECAYRDACVGCRGRVYACSGDYLEADPVCLKDLMVEEKVSPFTVKRFGWCVGKTLKIGLVLKRRLL